MNKSMSTTCNRLSELPKPKPNVKPPPNPAFTAGPINYQALGITPRMRIFLIVAITIMGTVETYTWSIFLYNRIWKKLPEDEDEYPFDARKKAS